jgi:Ion channel
MELFAERSFDIEKSKQLILKRWLAGIIAATIIVLPVAFAVGRWSLTITSLFAAFALSGIVANLTGGGIRSAIFIAVSSSAAFTILGSHWASAHLTVISAAPVTGILCGFVVGLIGDRMGKFVIIGALTISALLQLPFWITRTGWNGLLGYLLVIVCLPIGFFGGRISRPLLIGFEHIAILTREMGRYLVAFVIGYIAIAAIFAGWYWSLSKLIGTNECFKGLSDHPSPLDFFYFSTTTITTLGYGDVAPLGNIARILTSLEAMCGIGWITLVFATVVAIVQRRFDKIAEQFDQTSAKSQMEGIVPQNDLPTRPR